MRISTLTLILTLASPLAAQDMIGVGWGGGVYLLDSFTGATTYLGNGLSGQNSLARTDDGTLWSTRRFGNVYSLTTIDKDTGAATEVYSNTEDFRGLARASGTDLWGIADGPDRLCRIDTTNGTVTVIGSVGQSGLQSLCNFDGTLYAWDVNQGLIQIDQTTGAGTALDITQANGIGSDIQWLAKRSDGKLIGGGDGIFLLDPLTGEATVLATSSSDLRGAEPIFDWTTTFGSGCNGAGGQVTSSVTIGATDLTFQSTNHEANTVGIVIFSLNSTQSGGVPLPFNVDAIFGTSGCSLLVSPDVSFPALTSATFPATLDLQAPILPGFEGNTLVAQHIVLENVPGGISFSDGAGVQFGF